MFKWFKKNNIKLDYVALTIQLVSSLFILYLVGRLNILPTMYFLTIAAILLVILLVIGVPLLKIKKKKILKVCLRVLSLVISIALLFTSYQYIVRGEGFLSSITGAKYETNVISAYVLVDSPLETITDAKDSAFAYKESLGDSATYLTSAIEDINKKVGTEVVISSVSGYQELTDQLYDGTTPVILVNEAEIAFVEMFKGDFETETKQIYQYEKKVLVDNEESDKNVTNDAFTIYLSGIDTYGPVSTKSRSDVNLLITVNPKTKKILMTSIPRDYYVELASFGAKDKLTHAGIYGVTESINTLENLLDIEIDYYARVNFTSVVDVVDALGGVDVYSKYTFTTLHGDFAISEGNNHMDGETALGFVRERYSLPGGDNDRVINQQELLKGIINKALSPSILMNYTSFLSSLSDSFELSMSSNDLTSLIKMQLADGGSWEIEQISLKGTGSSSTTTYSMPGYTLYVMEPDMESVHEATQKIKQIFAGQ